MKKLTLFITIFLSSISFSEAQEIHFKKQQPKPDKVDKILLANSINLLVTDWGQTLDIKNHRNRHETNRLLGKRPDDHRINTYFTVCTAANFLAANYIENSELRKAVQVAVIILESIIVYRNEQLGIISEVSGEREPVILSMVFEF